MAKLTKSEKIAIKERLRELIEILLIILLIPWGWK
jgi:hypothetical protein